MPLLAQADNTVSAIFRDFVYTCAARRVARLTASAGVPTYVYEFARRIDPSPVFPGLELGATHSADVEYMFGTDLYTGPSEEKAALSHTLRQYLTSFADKGKPKAQHAPNWPKYIDKSDKNAPHERYLKLDVKIERHHPYAASNKCDFWDALVFPELTP